MPIRRPNTPPSIMAARIAVAIRSFCSSFIGFFSFVRGKDKYFSPNLQENFEISFVLSIFAVWITTK